MNADVNKNRSLAYVINHLHNVLVLENVRKLLSNFAVASFGPPTLCILDLTLWGRKIQRRYSRNFTTPALCFAKKALCLWIGRTQSLSQVFVLQISLKFFTE